MGNKKGRVRWYAEDGAFWTYVGYASSIITALMIVRVTLNHYETSQQNVLVERALIEAAFGVGNQYHHGLGVPQDYEIAAESYQEAADFGHVEAQYNLGILHLGGLGLSQNDTEAVKRFREAAEQGHAMAEFKLGEMYDFGYGVGQDHQAAAIWYLKAANQGLVRPQYYLGDMYATGQGVALDYVQAYAWYSRATQRTAGDESDPQGTVADRAAMARDSIAAKMTPSQIVEVPQLAQAGQRDTAIPDAVADPTRMNSGAADDFESGEWARYLSVYQSPFVVHLRKSLDHYLGVSPEDHAEGTREPTIEILIDDLALFDRSYYRSKFIVLAINNGLLGGKTINVVFLDKSDTVFTAWVYRTSLGDYDLRGFWEKTVSDRYMQTVQENVRATREKNWPSL